MLTSPVKLPTLPSWSPTRVLLRGVVPANRRRLSLAQKQRKAFFFGMRMERYKLGSGERALPKGPQGAALQGSVGGGRGGVPAGRAQLCCSGPPASARRSIFAHRPPPSLFHVFLRRFCTWFAELKRREQWFYPENFNLMWSPGLHIQRPTGK